jgi:hypothetical protein
MEQDGSLPLSQKIIIQPRSSIIISWRFVLISHFLPIYVYFSHAISWLHTFRGIFSILVFLLFRLCQRICPVQIPFELFVKSYSAIFWKVPKNRSPAQARERDRRSFSQLGPAAVGLGKVRMYTVQIPFSIVPTNRWATTSKPVYVPADCCCLIGHQYRRVPRQLLHPLPFSSLSTQHSDLVLVYPVMIILFSLDRLCGLVVRVPAYRSRGPGFDSRSYQIIWEQVGI